MRGVVRARTNGSTATDVSIAIDLNRSSPGQLHRRTNARHDGRILIHPPLLKSPAPSLCEARAGRGLGRGARSIELSRSFEIPSPHFSVVGRGNRPRAWWWYQDAPRHDSANLFLTLPRAEYSFEDDSDKKAIPPQSSGVTKQFPDCNQESFPRG